MQIIVRCRRELCVKFFRIEEKDFVIEEEG